ncbi:MAG: alpha/beta hydrolase [Myxococcota bacterium]|nr:alpha/beta hydrolase [Myxococcota bacterium]
MTTIMCIPCPPFGTEYWTAVCNRLEDKKKPTKIVNPLSTASGLAEATQIMEDELSSSDEDIVILTHGATLNLALALSAHPKVKGIVLSNGSVSKQSILARLGSIIPSSVLKAALHPRISTKLFSSSLGMRRWVVNPYVMNHDMVVRVCNEFINDSKYRSNCLNWVGMNGLPLKPAADDSKPCLSIWGTHDIFHPLSERQAIDGLFTDHTAVDVPGGRYLHGLERPWETADHILEWCSKKSL